MRRSILAAALAVALLAGPSSAAYADESPTTSQSSDAVWTNAPGQEGLEAAAEREQLSSSAITTQQETSEGRPPWLACGWREKESKVIKQYPTNSNPNRKWILRCGNDDYGYFHIKKRHMNDWQNLANYTNQGWTDVADLAISAALSSPEVVKQVGGDQTCRARTIYLVDKRTGKTVKTSKVRMFTQNKNFFINTAFPAVGCP